MWLTNKETGGHFNTDWANKEHQIAANKAEADKLNEEQNLRDILPKKSVISKEDLKEYQKYSEYSGQLAEVMVSLSVPVHQISHNGGKAFADVTESNDSYHIEMMGSTGKGAGTEILRQVAQKALANNRSLKWDADVASALKYYSHIGADKYGVNTGYGKSYNVSVKELPAFIDSLKYRKGKK